MGSIFRKGAKETGQSSGMSNNMGWMADQLFNQTGPLRKQTFGDLSSMLKGGTPSFLVGPTQNASSQIAQLGRQMQESGIRGGQLRQGMAMLPMQRMGLLDQIRSSGFDKALSAGMTGATSAFSGMDSAARNLNELGQQRQLENYRVQQGLGGLTTAAVKGMGMCWIAERLYGVSDSRTHLLRFWLLVHRPSWWLTKLYRRVGQWVSQQAWCPLLRPVFGRLLLTAQAECSSCLQPKKVRRSWADF
jgi:hypothetical protein